MTTTRPAPHGWLILDKPLGLGSTQAVGAVKRNLREGAYARAKVGHGGTLDPLATGVLPIAIGEATKLAGRMLDADKIYEFTIAFGTQTSGLDAEGEVVARSPHRPRVSEVRALTASFTGAIEQVPPVYSAIRVDGERAYARARAGEAVELAPRSVTIHDLRVIHPGLRAGDPPIDRAVLRAHVSKGTYIRSLARDIALGLGTCGHVEQLRRLKAGPFTLDQAISLDKLNEIGKGAPLEPYLLPLEAGLDDIPALTLSPEQARAVREGRVLSGLPQSDGLYWARHGGNPSRW